ncbi:MAG: radical SAM protein [archaeon]
MEKLKLSKKEYFNVGKVPLGIGAIMGGWNFTEEEFRKPGCLNVEFRAFTKNCPLNCGYCFTDKLECNLSKEEIKDIILQLKSLGTKTISFVGEGEPTIDPNFMEIMSFCYENNIKAVVFSEGTSKLKNLDFVKKLKKYNVTIVLKCDSLYNEEYQNKVVNSKNYFKNRNELLSILIKEKFNRSNEAGTTNIGLNMIVTQFNKTDVLKTVKFGRENNIFVMVVEFLMTGRAGKENFDKSMVLPREEIKKLREEIRKMDEEKYGFFHSSFTSYTSVPCTIYGGVHIYGNGDVGRCAGNDKVLGNLRKELLKDIWNRIKLDKSNFQGECPYRISAHGG